MLLPSSIVNKLESLTNSFDTSGINEVHPLHIQPIHRLLVSSVAILSVSAKRRGIRLDVLTARHHLLRIPLTRVMVALLTDKVSPI